MKKVISLIMVVVLLLLSFPNIVYAQSGDIFPTQIASGLPVEMRALEYEGFEFVQEHERVYEYIVSYSLPYKYNVSVGTFGYVLYYKWEMFLRRGSYSNQLNSYMLEEVVTGENTTEFYFRITFLKSIVDDYYGGNVENILARDSAMYIRSDYIEPEKVMKNFLRAEPNFDNGTLVGNWGEEKYYLYLDAYVYLPDGTKRSITIMPDLIEDYFENYDFVVVAFNLSPRARFWSPDIYPSESISGLSYIVYDLSANTTTFYDYQGNVVFRKNSIIYIDNPQFFVPEMEALDYQLKASYEEGKTEGYRQGREEGIRAGKRQTQEEMQRIIDELLERHEEELRKAYNEGKMAGANEDFDIFAYLQALFGEQGLGRLLRLELLPGVSLGAVIMIPLAFWLVSFIMRWFR